MFYDKYEPAQYGIFALDSLAPQKVGRGGPFYNSKRPSCGFGFRVEGLGFRVWGLSVHLGFRGVGFRASGRLRPLAHLGSPEALSPKL